MEAGLYKRWQKQQLLSANRSFSLKSIGEPQLSWRSLEYDCTKRCEQLIEMYASSWKHWLGEFCLKQNALACECLRKSWDRHHPVIVFQRREGWFIGLTNLLCICVNWEFHMCMLHHSDNPLLPFFFFSRARAWSSRLTHSGSAFYSLNSNTSHLGVAWCQQRWDVFQVSHVASWVVTVLLRALPLWKSHLSYYLINSLRALKDLNCTILKKRYATQLQVISISFLRKGWSPECKNSLGNDMSGLNPGRQKPSLLASTG